MTKTIVRPEPSSDPLARLKKKRRLPASYFAAFLVLASVPIFLRDDYYLHVMIAIFYNLIYVTTFRAIHRTGQFHFGAHGFIGVGAYASVLLVMKLGLPFWLALPLAGLLSAGLAAGVGYPTLRLKGIYFAIITWGFADSLKFLYIQAKEPFGGAMGIFSIPAPNPIPLPFFGPLDFSQKTHYYFLGLALLMLTIYVLFRLERSRYGLIFNAIREGDHLARSVGVNIMNYKVLAFAVCSGLAALGGAFYAHYTGYIAPMDFSINLTIALAVYMVVGGMDRFGGCIIGTVILMLLGEIFAGYAQYQLLLYSGFMIFVLLLLPEGLVSLPRLVRSHLARRAGRPEKAAL
ncbi:MAG: branched-chain amino acid ABC transporter permease [Pseudomonadota bacterium]